MATQGGGKARGRRQGSQDSADDEALLERARRFSGEFNERKSMNDLARRFSGEFNERKSMDETETQPPVVSPVEAQLLSRVIKPVSGGCDELPRHASESIDETEDQIDQTESRALVAEADAMIRETSQLAENMIDTEPVQATEQARKDSSDDERDAAPASKLQEKGDTALGVTDEIVTAQQELDLDTGRRKVPCSCCSCCVVS